MSRVELTATSYIVLGLLEAMGEGSVYDLKQAVAVSVGNFWSVPHSQLYREADRLETAGLLSARDDPSPGGRPRRVFKLATPGREALETWREDVAVERLPELRDPGLLKLFFGADPRRLAAARLEAHQRQLTSYETRFRAAPDVSPEGPRLTLQAGIGHEREWVRFWKRLAG